jgi:hypothetical protein
VTPPWRDGAELRQGPGAVAVKIRCEDLIAGVGVIGVKFHRAFIVGKFDGIAGLVDARIFHRHRCVGWLVRMRSGVIGGLLTET